MSEIWTPDRGGDPLTFPWKGIAAHGNTPFDCKLVTKIDDGFYLGGCVDGLYLPPDVEYVVSLYPWERYKFTQELEGELYLKLYDAAMDAPDMYYLAADMVTKFRARGSVLLHCQAGLNRSGTVAVLHLVRGWPSMTEEDALAYLREKRSPAVVCNPHFEEWLLAGGHDA